MRVLNPVLLCVSLVLCPVFAQAARSDVHAGIAAERRALNERFDAEERGCRERFAVTACSDDVRLRRRQALAPLRQQELALDDVDRQERAAEREAAVAAKQRAVAARPPASAPHARVRAPRPSFGAASAAGIVLPDHAAVEAVRQAQAAARVRDSAQRRAEAAAMQARIAEREAKLQARNKARGKQPDPLPVPEAGSAAGGAATPDRNQQSR